ncbi:hypothetical protein C8R45DRAFT_497462 [Mycena sanguinolenta]|nr:hypothetical protein C8R45DRAFT_497462 [Mycena sanguinolenta]
MLSLLPQPRNDPSVKWCGASCRPCVLGRMRGRRLRRGTHPISTGWVCAVCAHGWHVSEWRAIAQQLDSAAATAAARARGAVWGNGVCPDGEGLHRQKAQPSWRDGLVSSYIYIGASVLRQCCPWRWVICDLDSCTATGSGSHNGCVPRRLGRLRALCCGHAVRMVLHPNGNLKAAPCCRRVIVQASFRALVPT